MTAPAPGRSRTTGSATIRGWPTIPSPAPAAASPTRSPRAGTPARCGCSRTLRAPPPRRPPRSGSRRRRSSSRSCSAGRGRASRSSCSSGGASRVEPAVLETHLGEPVERADADWIRERTGFAIGGIPPVGHDPPLRTVADAGLAGETELWAAGGTPHTVFPLRGDELVALTGAELATVAAEASPSRRRGEHPGGRGRGRGARRRAVALGGTARTGGGRADHRLAGLAPAARPRRRADRRNAHARRRSRSPPACARGSRTSWSAPRRASGASAPR